MSTVSDLHDFLQDTIVALSTPMGKGALAVIRVSGSDAFPAISPFFKTKRRKTNFSAEELKTKKRQFGIITDGKRIIDEVVLSLYQGPHSYTGEDIVEISCHCNPFIIREIIKLLQQRGRIAKPGEFTQRAFYNNRMDLTRAEAVGDLLNASTELAHRAALSQLEGNLYKKIAKLLEELTSYRIELELEIDFSEQDLPKINTDKLKSNLSSLTKELQRLLDTGKEGLILREGLRVCLTGSPNVSKSSLFNYLLASNRAIVTSIPGTTRDYLEESLSLNGYLVRLYDTAGLRTTEEEVEAIGISRTHDLMEQADRIVYIEDGEQTGDKLRQHPFARHNSELIKILNKADILPKEKIDEYRQQGFIICSAKTGAGIESLKEKITDNLILNSEKIEAGILSNMRQIDAVEKSLKAIKQAQQSLENNLGYEFTAFDLKVASEALEEIIGKITTDEILHQIFSNFCIGK